MSTSISLSNKSNIVTYRNSINNNNSDKDSDNDSGGDSDSVNEGYGMKIICTRDESETLVNDGTTILQIHYPP